MKSIDKSGTIIKEQRTWCGTREVTKTEVKQTLKMLFARGYSDFVFGNNFVKAIFHSGVFVLKMGAGKNRIKQIDLDPKEAVRMAKYILIEYGDQIDDE